MANFPPGFLIFHCKINPNLQYPLMQKHSWLIQYFWLLNKAIIPFLRNSRIHSCPLFLFVTLFSGIQGDFLLKIPLFLEFKDLEFLLIINPFPLILGTRMPVDNVWECGGRAPIANLTRRYYYKNHSLM